MGLVAWGFIDVEEEVSPEAIEITDFKSTNIPKKKKYFQSENYNQVNLYCYIREKEGKKISWSGVHLISRKGHHEFSPPLRLEGVSEKVELPYSRERAEKTVEGMVKTAYEISDYYKTYLKIFS
jgi:hypothetical protein